MHVNSGHASARQLKRVLAAPDGGNSHSPNSFLEHCATRRDSDKVPNVLVVATSTAPMFNGKVQVDLLFLDDIVARRAMDMFPKCSLILRVRPENPQEV